MKYVISWIDGDGGFSYSRKYYVSHREGGTSVEITSSQKLAEAKLFSKYDADGLVYKLNMDIFMGCLEVYEYSEMELFEAKLKGK